MPVTRTNSLVDPYNHHRQLRAFKPHNSSESEVIIVSSDEEDVPLPRKRRAAHRGASKLRSRRRPRPSEEVVVISDGESTHIPSTSKELIELRQVSSATQSYHEKLFSNVVGIFRRMSVCEKHWPNQLR